jgi:hypothetical protein|tara:strand:+ start:3549 stop:3827 length:279 start_codon:yes stop_codon:yes gene_type:complete
LSQKINVGVDGIQRPQEKDREISQNVGTLFGSATGQAVLKYLRSITIEMVNGPNVTTEELRHMEGQRYIVGLIENRMAHAHKVKNNGRKSSK